MRELAGKFVGELSYLEVDSRLSRTVTTTLLMVTPLFWELRQRVPGAFIDRPSAGVRDPICQVKELVFDAWAAWRPGR